MAKMIPQTLKFVDLVMQITDDKQLCLCADCEVELVVTSIVLAEASNFPEKKSLTHNMKCPECGGICYITLNSKPLVKIQ